MPEDTSPAHQIMDEAQAEMAAGLINSLRPGWPEAGIYQYLESQLGSRTATNLLSGLIRTAADLIHSVPAADGSVDRLLSDIERARVHHRLSLGPGPRRPRNGSGGPA